jgi:hypothetical protein
VERNANAAGAVRVGLASCQKWSGAVENAVAVEISAFLSKTIYVEVM